jgi:hypothetical protein
MTLALFILAFVWMCIGTFGISYSVIETGGIEQEHLKLCIFAIVGGVLTLIPALLRYEGITLEDILKKVIDPLNKVISSIKMRLKVRPQLKFIQRKKPDFMRVSRVAAIVSLAVCIVLFFLLLSTIFTEKVETLLVFTQEGSSTIHGIMTCTKLDASKPIVQTTLYEESQCTVCRDSGCINKADSTTITIKNYVAPLVISVFLSSIIYFLLAKRKKE